MPTPNQPYALDPLDVPAFSLEEYQARNERLYEEMDRLNLDVFVIAAPDNMYYLTGYDSFGYYQFQAAVFERATKSAWLVLHEVEGGVAEQSTWVEDIVFWQHSGLGDPSGVTAPGDAVGGLVERLRKLGRSDLTIGVELGSPFLSAATYQRLQSELPQASFVDGTSVVPQLRARKSAAEVAYLRSAARLSDLGVLTAVDAAKAGARETDVAAAVIAAMTSAGSEISCMPPMILSGTRTVAVHQTASTKVIGPHDHMTIEIAGVVRRYNSNILRSFAPAGVEPRAEFLEAYELICRAFTACVEAAGPGVPGAELDRISRRITESQGRYRLHRTGYGLEAGYPPAWMGALSLSMNDPLILEPGMVFSIEPTLIYFDRPRSQAFSALVGSNILVTDNGVEVLNSIPLSLS